MDSPRALDPLSLAEKDDPKVINAEDTNKDKTTV